MLNLQHSYPQDEPEMSHTANPKKKLSFVFTLLIFLLLFGTSALMYVFYKQYLLQKQLSIPQIQLPRIPLATKTGNYCYLSQQGNNNVITYYSDGTKYLMTESFRDPDSENSFIFNILYNDDYYYLWTTSSDADQAPNLIASVYTSAEAKELSLDKSAQVSEILKNPNNCSPWQVEPQKFIPPVDVRFETVKETMNNLRQTSLESTAKLCNVCKEQFKTREEQIDCFSVGFIFTQSPRVEVEKVFDQHCFKQ